MSSNTKLKILNVISSMQQRGFAEVQPKDIIDNSKLSHQTIYVNLQELVKSGYLKKRSEGKNTYYSVTPEGNDLLQKAKELEHKSLTEPVIKNIANQLIEEHSEEFKGISYNIITDFLSEQLKDLEDKTLRAACDHFVKKKKTFEGT